MHRGPAADSGARYPRERPRSFGAKARLVSDFAVRPEGAQRRRKSVNYEAWFRDDTEVIDFFAPPRDDLLLGGKPAYMSES